MDVVTEDILTLLATTVLADKRIFAQEVEAFIKSSRLACISSEISPVPSDSRLLIWFEMNRDEIKSKLEHANFESWFTSLLKRLHAVPQFSDIIINEMNKISSADSEVHVSEKALMVLVARHLEIKAAA